MSYSPQDNYSPLNNYSYDDKSFVISTLDCFSAPLRWLLGARDIYSLSYTHPMSLDRKIATLFFVTLTCYLAPSFGTVLVGVFVGSLALKYVFSYISSEKDKAIGAINSALQRKSNQEKEAARREEAVIQQRLEAQKTLEVQIQQLKGEFDTLFNANAWWDAVRIMEKMPSQGRSSVNDNLYKCFENIISSGNYSIDDVRGKKSFQALGANECISLIGQIQTDKSSKFYNAFKDKNWRLAIDTYAQIPRQKEGTLPSDLHTCVHNIIESGEFNWDEIVKYIKLLEINDYTAIIDLVIRSKLDSERKNNQFFTTGYDLCGFVCNLLGDGNIKKVFECTEGILVNILLPNSTQDNILTHWIKLNLVDEMIESYKNRIESKHAGKFDLIWHKSDKLRLNFSSKIVFIDPNLYGIFKDLEKMQKVNATINMLRSATDVERQQVNAEVQAAMNISAINKGFINKLNTLKTEKVEFSSLQEACLEYDGKLSNLCLSSSDEEKRDIKSLQKFIIEVIRNEKKSDIELKGIISKSVELNYSLKQTKQTPEVHLMEFLSNSIHLQRNAEFCDVINAIFFL